MPQVEIEKIIQKLRNRKDGGASKRFIEIYSAVVRNYLDYKKWVEMMIGKNGHYQGKGKAHIVPSYLKYIELIDNIAKNGIKRPVREFSDAFGYEIDGYHRLIIWKELGNKKIYLTDSASR